MHSPEPWTFQDTANGRRVVSSDGGVILEHEFGTHTADDPERALMHANLDRIVACVNFCRGIPTERLLEMSDIADRINARLAREELENRRAKA